MEVLVDYQEYTEAALEALRAVIDLSGLRSGALAVGGAQGAARLEGLAALERLAAAIVRRAPALEGAGLAGRLAALAELDYRGEVGASGQRIGVQVLTVHQAKGLEFDAVFVVGMVQRRWPGPQQRGTDIPDALLPEALPSERDAHVAESRRVAYVAMTRARHHLVLSAHAANAAGVPQRVAQFYEEAREVVGAAVEEVDPSPEDDALRQVAALRERFERAALRAAEAHDAAEADERRQAAVAAAEELVDARVAAQRGPLPQPVPTPVAAPARPGQTLTVTDVTTYLRCPLQYRFGRVDRIPQRDSPERRIGIGVHTALEGHYRPDGDGGDGARLVARVERELARLGVSEQAEGRQALRRARERLPDYAKRHGSRGEQAAAVEQSFTLSLGSHRVRGRIDRIDRYPDGYQLVDYKTGAPPGSPQGDASWTAVRLYAAGAQETWSFVPRGAALHYVLDGEQRPVDCDPPLVAEATALAREAADDVAAQRFDPRPGWHCRACDFRLLCPAQDR